MPARCTRIDNQFRMTAQQFIPIRQIAHDVLVFGDALTVGGVVVLPEAQRIDVVVLTIQVDTFVRDDLVNMVDQPLPRLRIAQVQQSTSGTAENPFGVLCGQPCSGGHTFRFEPEDDLDTLAVGMVADRPQAVWETVWPAIHFPGARPGPAVLRCPDVPTGIHPPVIQFQSLIEIAVDELESGSARWPWSFRRTGGNCTRRTEAAAIVYHPDAVCCVRSSIGATVFCASIQSPPFQNCITTRGVRTVSPGSSLKCVVSCPDVTCKPLLSSRW